MESFAAFGFAGTVMQLIYYSVQIIGRCKGVYRVGTTLEVHELSGRLSRIQTLSEAIQASLESFRTVTHREQALRDIATECMASAKKLQELPVNLDKPSDSQGFVSVEEFW